ncbi:MAG: peptidase [Pseudomonadota bacterium]
MTYCVALKLDHSLVFMSDTRTNAGIDNISVVRKMFTWSEPGERVITLMTAGNLATTQAVVSLLNERTMAPELRDPGIMQVPTLFEAARLVGDTLKEVVETYAGTGPTADSAFSATIIMGGQIAGMEPRLFMIYPEGNFVEAGPETPFFQIGETKYGRPIILRAMDTAMSVEDAVRLLCVSFDSTLKANLSVGMPLDIHVYAADSLQDGRMMRIEADDPDFARISSGWGDALKAALDRLPHYPIPPTPAPES